MISADPTIQENQMALAYPHVQRVCCQQHIGLVCVAQVAGVMGALREVAKVAELGLNHDRHEPYTAADAVDRLAFDLVAQIEEERSLVCGTLHVTSWCKLMQGRKHATGKHSCTSWLVPRLHVNDSSPLSKKDTTSREACSKMRVSSKCNHGQSPPRGSLSGTAACQHRRLHPLSLGG